MNCKNCGHWILHYFRDSFGELVSVFVDNDPYSPTFNEEITRCPTCGAWLASDMVEVSDEA